MKWGQDETAEAKQQKELAELQEQINPKDGYALPVSYGKLGPQLIEAGVIDHDAFMQVMKSSGDLIADCGAGLQSEWVHCPQCGASVSG